MRSHGKRSTRRPRPLVPWPRVSSGTFDVERLLAMPRVAGVAVSRDGRRVVTTVSVVAPDGKRYRSSIWEIDADGDRPPRRLTRSDTGESLGGFLPDGALLFTTARPDPDAEPRPDTEREAQPGLWLLPAGGGDAAPVATPAGGVEAVAVARDAGTVACFVPVFPGAGDWEEDRRLGEDRRRKGVGARLYDTYPIRFWDRYLGPRRRHVAAGTWAVSGAAERRLDLRDLTPDAGDALEECELAVTPDGATVVTTWRGVRWYSRLVAIDVATGERRTLVEGDRLHVSAPACSPDGRRVAFLAERVGSPGRGLRVGLWVAPISGGTPTELLPDWPLWPGPPLWTEDSAALIVTADEAGARPVWRVEAGDPGRGRLTRLAAGAEFTDLAVAAGRVVAVRSTVSEPPHLVALEAAAAEQTPRVLPSPGHPVEQASRTEEVWIDAPDGRGRVQGWLTLPAGAADAPAPLVLFIHGGPFASFSGWHWRWSPHVLAGHGYAVLSANPALSTGFGWENVDRAWERWGEGVQPDLEALVDAVSARPDVDGSKLAAAGGSFGGYMANWLAGHSERFRCLVAHASVWALDQFHGTTDVSTFLEEEFGDPDSDAAAWRANNPRAALEAIARSRTPTLVIHGELDARVPVSEALRLWTDLRRRDVPSRFLYVPDETHWVLKPQNVRIWYATVLAFLDEHLRGRPFVKPELL